MMNHMHPDPGRPLFLSGRMPESFGCRMRAWPWCLEDAAEDIPPSPFSFKEMESKTPVFPAESIFLRTRSKQRFLYHERGNSFNI
ncbi:MAG: hypothetical protein D6757_10725 [Alphaproteobacteria bacterium]|nr:MAG: hypothetical protein D6757_10725 [Alphaproteobacteria bacterium]